ncbi:DUF4411 family protein [Leptospira sp. SA-E8]|uniref:DUF4411 family protein n=1 Tax=Leptospira sp. SA-E8 TaxID=3422259 RepID=UPI003EBE5DF8
MNKSEKASESTKALYALDANVFIQAHRAYYAFDIAPGYWAALLKHEAQGLVVSIDRVRDELLSGGKADALEQWLKKTAPETLFDSSKDVTVANTYAAMMQWVQEHPRFKPEAKTEFAGVADGWLLAYAKVHDLTVVTQEKNNPDKTNKVLIPVMGVQFGVKCIDTFDLLRALKTRLN